MITFFDSNVLIYSFDLAEPIKRSKALQRLEDARSIGSIALSTQVLHEFYSVCTRKLQPPLPHGQAVKAVGYLCEFMVIGSTASAVQSALSLVEQHQISWWDALILEAAIRADADILVSENGQHGRRFGKLTIENPFAEN